MSARDAIARALANAALGLASERYRKSVAGAIRYGMASAARDVAEGRPYPMSWAMDPSWGHPHIEPIARRVEDARMPTQSDVPGGVVAATKVADFLWRGTDMPDIEVDGRKFSPLSGHRTGDHYVISYWSDEPPNDFDPMTFDVTVRVTATAPTAYEGKGAS